MSTTRKTRRCKRDEILQAYEERLCVWRVHRVRARVSWVKLSTSRCRQRVLPCHAAGVVQPPVSDVGIVSSPVSWGVDGAFRGDVFQGALASQDYGASNVASIDHHGSKRSPLPAATLWSWPTVS